MYSHKNLDIYINSIHFLSLIAKVFELFPDGNSALIAQLEKKAISIFIHIKNSIEMEDMADKKKYLMTARAFAIECEVILDIFKSLKIMEEKVILDGKNSLAELIAMLSRISE